MIGCACKYSHTQERRKAKKEVQEGERNKQKWSKKCRKRQKGRRTTGWAVLGCRWRDTAELCGICNENLCVCGQMFIKTGRVKRNWWGCSLRRITAGACNCTDTLGSISVVITAVGPAVRVFWQRYARSYIPVPTFLQRYPLKCCEVYRRLTLKNLN